jgi:hypothetical protein
MKRYFVLIISVVIITSCTARHKSNQPGIREQNVTITSNPEGKGPGITLELFRGKSFYYPLMAVWLEDESGKYIQTLFVARSVATGIFRFGKEENGKLTTGPKRAPQTLPYWAHKRGIQASDGLFMPEPQNPVADAYSGATPVTGFILKSRADSILPTRFRVIMEINQNWDWNEYWTNDKYPGDENYKMSCQPALVYEAVIDASSFQNSYKMKMAGHSHYSGKTGELFTDLSTLTTALHIADSVLVKIDRY